MKNLVVEGDKVFREHLKEEVPKERLEHRVGMLERRLSVLQERKKNVETEIKELTERRDFFSEKAAKARTKKQIG